MSALSPPPDINLKADKGPHVIGAGITLIILPTVFVILRFVSRGIARAGLWWDDLLVVVSLLLNYGPNAAMMICESYRLRAWSSASGADRCFSGANERLWKTSMGSSRPNS